MSVGWATIFVRAIAQVEGPFASTSDRQVEAAVSRAKPLESRTITGITLGMESARVPRQPSVAPDPGGSWCSLSWSTTSTASPIGTCERWPRSFNKSSGFSSGGGVVAPHRRSRSACGRFGTAQPGTSPPRTFRHRNAASARSRPRRPAPDERGVHHWCTTERHQAISSGQKPRSEGVQSSVRGGT